MADSTLLDYDEEGLEEVRQRRSTPVRDSEPENLHLPEISLIEYAPEISLIEYAPAADSWLCPIPQEEEELVGLAQLERWWRDGELEVRDE